MKTFEKINTYTGWAMFLIATAVYWLTMEETASFWDCGEFIAVSYKLEVPHPPGAPFFLLMGRLFSFLAMGDVTKVAYAINLLSVFSSSFTILFLYWTIVYLGRKIIKAETGEYSLGQTITLVGGGVVGALAYTFSDSFWFSAVEAEVYAMSSFFTAFVFWAMLKWEYIESPSASTRWLLVIVYMMGLSIGVHLLNLVTIPALGLIYLYKKNPQPTTKEIIYSLLISGLIILVIMYGIIPGLPTLGGDFEVFCVNTLGLPFNFGIITFILVLVLALAYGIYYTQKHRKYIWNISLLGVAFILIGYTSYAIIIIRANYNTPINENDPSDAVRYVSYLKREQYGDRPLLYGPTFMAERVDVEIGEPIYRRGKDKYEIYDYKSTQIYDRKDQIILPRIYSQQPGHPELYRSWIGLKEGEKPNLYHNFVYMFKYQFGHMYFRYFLWNFAGRESDEKDATWLMPWDDFEQIPEELAMNKARANFYMLPLLLGIFGMFFYQKKDNHNFWMTMLLFFCTGLGLILYLNSPPVEPRERDYIYVGSFYVFTIWIGFGVYALSDFLKGILKNEVAAPAIATAICLFVPIQMGVVGWESHNRSNRFHSVDQAINTLNSCPPNAILFTGGDNDTFPLWYAQEVEGVRTDVRVAVLSYFSTDWYLDQMRRQTYESAPIPLGLARENYASGKNDYIPLVEDERAAGGVNLKVYLKLLNENNNNVLVGLQDGSFTGKLLSKTFVLDVDSAAVISKGIIPKGKESRVVSKMVWKLRNGYNFIYKNELALLDLIATNNWERPICFNNTSANTINMDLRDYLFLEGMTYRLLPIKAKDEGETGEVNIDEMLNNIAKYQYRGLNDPNTYNDEEYQKFGSNTRHTYYRLAKSLHEVGREKEAIRVLDEALEKIPDATIPYSFFMPRYVELYHELGEHDKAKQITEILGRRAEENIRYLARIKRDNENLRQRSLLVLQQLSYIHRRLAEREEKKYSVENTPDDSTKLKTIEEEKDTTKITSPMLDYYDKQAIKYNDTFYDVLEELEKSKIKGF
ncbi:MAG: DUF2723 domain-containing protein [Flammeovirgaceae bacterium]